MFGLLPLAMASASNGRSSGGNCRQLFGCSVSRSGLCRFFVGTTRRSATLKIAQRLEDDHRQIRFGCRPVPKSAEAGANVKELQTLARHSTPALTLNVYAKKRDERLAEWAERIGQSVLPKQACPTYVRREPVEAGVRNANFLSSGNLEESEAQWRRGDSNPRKAVLASPVHIRNYELSLAGTGT